MALKKLDVVTITEEMIDQVRSGSADPMVTIPPSMVTEYANPTQRITAAFTDRNNDYWRYHLGLADGYLKAYESVKSELARLDKSANPEVIEARAQALMTSLSGQKGWRFNQYCDHEGNFQVRPGLGIIASALGCLPRGTVTVRASQQGYGHLWVWRYDPIKLGIIGYDLGA